METSLVCQCGNAPDSSEQDGGIQELQERLVAKGCCCCPCAWSLSILQPEQTGSSSQAAELLLCQAGIAFHRLLGRTPLL